MFINYNGRLLEASEKVVPADNRSFTYGDSLFETIRIRKSLPVFFDAHYSRLLKGARLMQMDAQLIPQKAVMLEMIAELLEKNQQTDAVVRWQVFRQGNSLFEAGSPGFVISCRPFPAPPPADGINLGIYRDARKISDVFSSLKHGNYLPYIMGALYARNNHFEDAIILNQYGRICDSCLANIFILRQGNILTPSLSEGCIAGIYRQHLINTLTQQSIAVKETELTEVMLREADEIFLTNSIRGIIAVGRLEEKKIPVTETKKIIRLIE